MSTDKGVTLGLMGLSITIAPFDRSRVSLAPGVSPSRRPRPRRRRPVVRNLLLSEDPAVNVVNGRPKALWDAGFNSYSYFSYMRSRRDGGFFSEQHGLYNGF